MPKAVGYIYCPLVLVGNSQGSDEKAWTNLAFLHPGIPSRSEIELRLKGMVRSARLLSSDIDPGVVQVCQDCSQPYMRTLLLCR